MTVRPLDPAVIGEQCEHTVWVPEIESWVRCTANTLMHTPDTRVLCPEHCSCNEGASVDYPPLPDFLHAESEPVRYSKDEDGEPLTAWNVILGLGDYADEGEPDAVIRIWAGDEPTTQAFATVISHALKAWCAATVSTPKENQT